MFKIFKTWLDLILSKKHTIALNHLDVVCKLSVCKGSRSPIIVKLNKTKGGLKSVITRKQKKVIEQNALIDSLSAKLKNLFEVVQVLKLEKNIDMQDILNCCYVLVQSQQVCMI